MVACHVARRLVAGLATLTLLAGCSASASPTTVPVPMPNGTDDTANIQAALDACVKHGPSCTVQLGAGTYRTSQLVANGFKGTFKGAGKDQTIIEALPALSVTAPDFSIAGECLPNLTDCRWPSLIIFVDGDIAVSDLAIHVTAAGGRATAPHAFFGSTLTSLVDALRFMGQARTDVTIDRIAIEGRRDSATSSLVGFNLVNGILYAGELPRSSKPFDYHTLDGTFNVRSSSFSTMDTGVGADGFLASVTGTIGGSSEAGNQFRDVNTGIDLQTAQDSVFDVSFNTSAAISRNVSVGPWQPAFVPSSPSQYAIHDNALATSASSGDRAAGIILHDDATRPWIQAKVTNNTIKLLAPIGEGIEVENATGTQISGNSVIGTAGYDAIGLVAGSGGSISGNNVGGFTPDPSFGTAQIYLDAGTTHASVTCAQPGDTVRDLGTGNVVTGCAAAK
jgi:hypothetical protein